MKKSEQEHGAVRMKKERVERSPFYPEQSQCDVYGRSGYAHVCRRVDSENRIKESSD